MSGGLDLQAQLKSWSSRFIVMKMKFAFYLHRAIAQFMLDATWRHMQMYGAVPGEPR